MTINVIINQHLSGRYNFTFYNLAIIITRRFCIMLQMKTLHFLNLFIPIHII